MQIKRLQQPLRKVSSPRHVPARRACRAGVASLSSPHSSRVQMVGCAAGGAPCTSCCPSAHSAPTVTQGRWHGPCPHFTDGRGDAGLEGWARAGRPAERPSRREILDGEAPACECAARSLHGSTGQPVDRFGVRGGLWNVQTLEGTLVQMRIRAVF